MPAARRANAIVAILVIVAVLAIVGMVLARQLLFVITLLAVAGAATRHALGRDIESLQSGPTPGATVGGNNRPVRWGEGR